MKRFAPFSHPSKDPKSPPSAIGFLHPSFLAGKIRIGLLVSLLFVALSTLRSQDLPGCSANLQTLPSGSYVIPMDNTYQLNSSSLFNLKAYGLVVYLLNNNVKVKWVINTAKLKDGVDIVTTAQVVHPSTSSASIEAFAGGPFVIFASDLTGVDGLINSYYTANSLTGANRPKVYQTIFPTIVDVRYDMTGFKPKAGILTDGGNQSVHLAFMTAASVPASNFDTTSGSSLIPGCFTFASEPHNDKTGSAVDVAITSIRKFVTAGGNFLAECAAVENYENNPLGRFQTTTGIQVTNAHIGTTLKYPNPNLSFSQFVGAFNGSLTGKVENWQISDSGRNNENNHATGTGSSSSSIGASMSKLGSGSGGLVFYLGNHNFTTADIENINGIRMYLNAFLTPSKTVCASLPVTMVSFTAVAKNETAYLQWEVSLQINNKGFSVERSVDGINWQQIGFVNSVNGSSSLTTFYNYTDGSPLNGKNFYRLQQEDYDGHTTYSEIQVVDIASQQSIALWPNPVKDQLNIHVSGEESGALKASLFDMAGRAVKQVTLHAGMNTLSLNALPTGIYVVHVIMPDGETINEKLSKQ